MPQGECRKWCQCRKFITPSHNNISVYTTFVSAVKMWRSGKKNMKICMVGNFCLSIIWSQILNMANLWERCRRCVMDDIIEFSFWCRFWIHGKKPYVPIFICYFISYITPDLQSVPIKLIPPLEKQRRSTGFAHHTCSKKDPFTSHADANDPPRPLGKEEADSGEHGYRREGYSGNRKMF